jgi:hypothetical protein
MICQSAPRAQSNLLLPPQPPRIAVRLLLGNLERGNVMPRSSLDVPLGRRVLDRVLGEVGCELGAERVCSGVGSVEFVEGCAVEGGASVRRDELVVVFLLIRGCGGEGIVSGVWTV